MIINNNDIHIVPDYPEQKSASTQEAAVTYSLPEPRLFDYDELDHAYCQYVWRANPYQLGEGAFSKIYKTKLDDTDVVIKIHKPQFSKTYASPYENEKKAHEKLKHPNIIQLLGYIEMPNGFRALVLERAQMDLQYYLEAYRNAQRDPKVCKQYAKDIIKGLAYLHSVGKIHRDFKPSNVLIVSNTAKISDFDSVEDIFCENNGEAFFWVRNRGATVGYIPPEFYESSLITTRYDIYCLSIILYLLTTKDKTVLGRNAKVPATATVHWQYLIHRGLNEKPQHRPLIKEFVEAVNDPNLEFRPT